VDFQPGASRAAPAETTPALQPRYRRILTFSDILDESVRLYRQHFVTFAFISAVALLPSGLVLVGVSAAGLDGLTFAPADFQRGGRFSTPASLTGQFQQQISTALLAIVISSIFGLLWSAAIVLTSDAYFRGGQVSIGRVFARAVGRMAVILFSSLMTVVALAVLGAIATVLFVITVFGLVGGLIAGIGLLFWWLQPSWRRAWLKWLIILTAPFGLPAYFACRWVMFLAAIVLEDRGPLNALSRGSQLTEGQWFRVSSILTVAPLIVGVLVSVISFVVDIPLRITAAARGPGSLDPTTEAISTGLGVVLQILFGSVAAIVYTLLFHDLRNRREGTDIVERLNQLETAALPANG
jgi:hypothetical protein